jgi:hypothetical protein
MLMFRGQKVWYVVAGVLVLVTVLAVAFVVWRPFTKQSPSLLPASILQQITGFTPYFYTDQIPAGYAFDSSKIVFDGRVLLVPLTKPNEPGVVLSEQAFPSKLTDQDLQQNGEPVRFTAGTASINTIEGRLVGTLIPNDRKTLVLISSQSDQIKDDLTTLLQQLQPLPH